MDRRVERVFGRQNDTERRGVIERGYALYDRETPVVVGHSALRVGMRSTPAGVTADGFGWTDMELYVPPEMRGRTALVTGATRGIGYETARALAIAGATVGVHARDPDRGVSACESIRQAAGHDRIELYMCDFDDLVQVQRLAIEFRSAHARLDVLVNNAGAIYPRRELTTQGFERTWQVDHLAAFLLTNLLRDPLAAAAPSRVIAVSSDAHLRAFRGIDLQDPGLGRHWTPFKAYAQAKLANVMFAYGLARRWRRLGVASNAMHPGSARTAFGAEGWGFGGWIRSIGSPFLIDARRGADTIIWLAASPEVERRTGEYFYRRRAKRSGTPSYDEAAQDALWRLSAEQVRLAQGGGG
jgi:NAD(P)-dependent dehydrogenase (short-subunit alcohol dehydrogenase family)